jgi:hypothetical protein
MDIERGMVCYEALICYLNIGSIHCYDMWASAGFTGSSCPNWSFNDIGLITTTTTQYGPNRVLTLVLSGGVEVLPIVYPLKPGVMGGLC